MSPKLEALRGGKRRTAVEISGYSVRDLCSTIEEQHRALARVQALADTAKAGPTYDGRPGQCG